MASAGLPAQPLNSATFLGFVSTQFLGAFNDNYFKQMVLLSCIAQMAVDMKDRQPLAMAAFALPFVLLSGFGGYLSDRLSKQRIVVGCKLAEIFVMALALAVLILPGIGSATQLYLLIVVLALMGAQSAIFGPSKYGVLPELFRSEQLITVNGIVQMTTFLAIIFGVTCAGLAMDLLKRSLWLGSLIAVAIAVLGTATSLLIRRTWAVQPELVLRWENLAIPREIWLLLRQQPPVARALLVFSTFWFIGGVAQPAVNLLGKESLGLTDTRTSMLTAGIGVGIAAGCVLVGVFGRSSGGSWVRGGAWGVLAALLATGILGSHAAPAQQADVIQETLWRCLVTAAPLEWCLRLSLTGLGIAAGIFVVPIQAFLQRSPPAEQKGRVIGVQNLCSWIGILLSAAYLSLANWTLLLFYEPDQAGHQQHYVFLSLAVVILPIAVWYQTSELTTNGN